MLHLYGIILCPGKDRWMIFILEAPTYLNLRLGTGSRVLYLLSLLRTAAVGKWLRSLSFVLFYGWLLPVGPSSGSTKHSSRAPAMMCLSADGIKPTRSHPCLPPCAESVPSASMLSLWCGLGQALANAAPALLGASLIPRRASALCL